MRSFLGKGEAFNEQKTSLNRQPFPALCPPAVDQFAASLGGHARQKAMGPGFLDLAGLICSFHNILEMGNRLWIDSNYNPSRQPYYCYQVNKIDGVVSPFQIIR
jgi:hypothetical protein